MGIRTELKDRYEISKKFLELSRNSEEFIFPDFLIIGVQKAGTTWLYRNLNEQKGIFLPTLPNSSDPTEVRYFSHYFHKPLRWYSNLYKNHAEFIKGDKTPKNYLLPVSKIKFIRELNPNIKIILLLRNPVHRAWSQAVMNLLRFNSIHYKHFPKKYEKFILNNIPRGYYSGYIKNWYSVFSHDQILIGLYDDIKLSPKTFLKEVLDFLGYPLNDVKYKNIERRVNENPHEKIPLSIKEMLDSHYYPEIVKLINNYDLNLKHWLKD